MLETIGILSFQGDVRNHARMVEQVGAAASLVRTADDLKNLDGLIIPGGESTTISKMARNFNVTQPLRDYINEGLPVFGTCAGMVLLADHIEPETHDQFGGLDMVVARNAFGRQNESFERPLKVLKIHNSAQAFPGVFIRAPLAHTIGSSVEILSEVSPETDSQAISQFQKDSRLHGTLKDGNHVKKETHQGPSSGHNAVAVRQEKLLATSFHPELTDDVRMHTLFIQMIRNEA